MGRSVASNFSGEEWWIDKIMSDGRRQYPKRIVVGHPISGRVYMPERTCRMVPMPFNGAPPYRRSNVVLDGMTDGCSECGYPIKARLRETPNFCPNCGATLERGDGE